MDQLISQYAKSGWIAQVFSIEIRKVLSYRVDFWMQFLANVLAQVAIAYFLWKAIYDYRGVDELGGYSFAAMMLYYLCVPLVNRMIRGPEMAFISQEIYDGTLNRYLIYPISFFGYKYVAHMAQSFIYALQFLVGIGVYGLLFDIPPDVRLGWTSFVMGFGAGFIGSLLYFIFASILELVAFWADNVWSLLVMLRFFIHFFGGALIPLSLFPEWSRPILDILPFGYLASFPIRCFMGDLNWLDWTKGLLIMTLWIIVLSRILWKVWHRGTLQYTGVGI